LHANDIYKIENFVRAGFAANEWSKVHSVHTSFVKMGVFLPIQNQIYPYILNKDIIVNKNQAQYIFEPSITGLIDQAVPKIVKILLYSYLVESRASENSARSFAMKRANESAGELLGELKIKYNKVRQDGITQEIAEISAGANV
jgi:F-type H+-transporting ATPase subunit gamma